MQITPISDYLDVRHELRRSFDETLDFWGDRLPPGVERPIVVAGISKVLNAIAQLDHALDRLGNREARGGVKQRLQADRKRLGDAVAALESLAVPTGGNVAEIRKFKPCGPRYLELEGKFLAADAAVLAAQQAMHAARRDTVLARRQDLDLAQADLREASRSIESLRAAATFPALPNLDAMRQAEQQSKEIARLASIKSQPATALRAALEQGASTSKEAAAYWPCFSSAGGKAAELYALRQQMFNETHGLTAEQATAAE